MSARLFVIGQPVEVLWPNHDGQPARWEWMPATVTNTREVSYAVGGGYVRVSIQGRDCGHYDIPLERVRTAGGAR